MTRRAGVRASLALLALTGAVLVTAAWRHPIHTTLTEIEYDQGTDSVRVVMRVFADDFGAAVGGGALTPQSMARYLSSTFLLRDRAGSPVRFTWKGTRQTDEVIWIELHGSAAAGLRGGTLRNEMVFTIHSDQVNIVKARYGGREQTMLFTRSMRTREIP